MKKVLRVKHLTPQKITKLPPAEVNSVRRSSSMLGAIPQIELLQTEFKMNSTQSSFFKTFSEMPKLNEFTKSVQQIPSPMIRINYQLDHNKKERQTIISQSLQLQKELVSKAIQVNRIGQSKTQQKLRRREFSPTKAVGMKPQQIAYQLPKLDNQEVKSSIVPEPPTFFIEAQKLLRDVKTFKPSFVEGTTLALYNECLYLYGGIGGAGIRSGMMKYDIRAQVWSQLISLGDVPKTGKAGLTMVQYKNKAIYFGGAGMFNKKMKQRECSNSLYEFNLATNVWLKVRPNGDFFMPRRHHKACIIGSKWMLVHGGINTNEEVLGDLALYNIEKENWRVVDQFIDLPLCCHAIVNTSLGNRYPEQTSDVMSADSVYLFGGKDPSGNSSNLMRKLHYCQNTQQPMCWEVLKSSGTGPYPCHNHTMEFMKKNQTLVVIGGKYDDRIDGYLESMNVYLYYTLHCVWQIVIIEGLKIPRCAHNSLVLRQRIVIFGGIGNDKYLEPDVSMMETDQNSVKSKIIDDRIAKKNAPPPSPEPLKISKRKSLIYEEPVLSESGEASSPAKSFRINLRRPTVALRTYMPQKKTVLMRYDILIGFVKQIINEVQNELNHFYK